MTGLLDKVYGTPIFNLNCEQEQIQSTSLAYTTNIKPISITSSYVKRYFSYYLISVNNFMFNFNFKCV